MINREYSKQRSLLLCELSRHLWKAVTNGNLQLLFERHTTDTLRIHDVVPQWTKDAQCFIILLQCFLETSLSINTNNKGLVTGKATQYPSKPL